MLLKSIFIYQNKFDEHTHEHNIEQGRPFSVSGPYAALHLQKPKWPKVCQSFVRDGTEG